MDVYSDFAYFYHKGSYPEYSRTVAEALPTVLKRFRAKPKAILDIACGEGTFAIAIARRRLRVTGVDQSEQMLQLARAQAQEAGVKVEFIHRDMRDLRFSQEFDLVTCLYDSLNYLLERADLEKAFRGAAAALTMGGLFIFDMNTVYGLSTSWQRQGCYVQQDTDELFEVHRPKFDYEKSVATLTITGFRKQEETWVRMEEAHKERAYPVYEIVDCLEAAGFEVLARWGSIVDMTEYEGGTGRVWLVARKARP